MKAQDVNAAPGNYAIFMVFGINHGEKATAKIKELCGSFATIQRSMRNRFPKAQASTVIGFGADAWGHLFPGLPRPKELQTFKEIKGNRFTAPSTPGDIFFHIRAAHMDICYEMATLLRNALADAVTPVDEVHGFRMYDGRAIIGFVDGTENPDDEERTAFACIGAEDAQFEGGSYAFVQKYLHDMEKWNTLPLPEQEDTIGRRKFNDLELTDEEKPKNAHNAVTNIKSPDGEELKIVRANMPFAKPGSNEHGTYFIGYARYFSTTRKMLENMFIGDPIGNTDLLLEVSTAVTGTLFFVPTLDMLEELAD